MGRLENARRDSNVEFVFTSPRKLDLGLEKKAGTVGVEVKDMVITLPVCSGRVWIDSIQFRWVCSGFDTNLCGNLEALLGVGRLR